MFTRHDRAFGAAAGSMKNLRVLKKAQKYQVVLSPGSTHSDFWSSGVCIVRVLLLKSFLNLPLSHPASNLSEPVSIVQLSLSDNSVGGTAVTSHWSFDLIDAL